MQKQLTLLGLYHRDHVDWTEILNPYFNHAANADLFSWDLLLGRQSVVPVMRMQLGAHYHDRCDCLDRMILCIRT